MSHHDTIAPASGQALLPCPFCGGNDIDRRFPSQDYTAPIVVCDGCGSTAESIDAWNRRQPDRLAQIETRLKAWFAAKYPEGADLLQFTAKVMEEWSELLKAHHEGRERPILEESADVVIVLANMVRTMGHGLSLFTEVERKLAIVERRLTDPNYGRGAK
jgi:phosphoribosyl-ATP pyrophosphohydrolase/predicted RNA-binding Zn-ribbon protein involved in translation (DUF1610 family)